MGMRKRLASPQMILHNFKYTPQHKKLGIATKSGKHDVCSLHPKIPTTQRCACPLETDRKHNNELPVMSKSCSGPVGRVSDS